jgi:hypothetical protein
MVSFRSAEEQARHAVRKNVQLGTARHTNRADQKIHSVGTMRIHEQALTRVAEWIRENRLGDLKSLTPETAIHYLEQRGQTVGQKTLAQERQALQTHLGVKLPVVKAELTQAQKSRAYTSAQVDFIVNAQTEKNTLATQLAYAAGLRAHELFTLLPKEERAASAHRQWSADRFVKRTGKLYTVIGKGGLIREVLIPSALANELEKQRLAAPTVIEDRGVYYTQHYNINGGVTWSSSFSAASKRALGWSTGAHGLRHSYAQERMKELQSSGYTYETALGLVSQAMGHFRSSITEVYLR